MPHPSVAKVHDASLAQQLMNERARLGLTQTQLAEAGGVSKRSQIMYYQGRSPAADYLAAIASAGADVVYISTGLSSRDRLARQAADDLHMADEFASIPVHDAFLVAGHAAQNDTEAVIAHLAFRRDWLARMSIAIDNARIARVRGDSMAPTLTDDDLALIDMGRREVMIRKRAAEDRRLPSIYAVLTDGGPRIKRVERPEKDQMHLILDNPKFPVEVLTGSAVRAATIIGEVVWWGHAVKK